MNVIARTLIGALLLVPRTGWAEEDTCSNTEVDGDLAMWEDFPSMTETWLRDELASYYNIQEGDWDESWGWSKYNDPDPHKYEFGKMMSSGMLLWAGIESDPLPQGVWTDRHVNGQNLAVVARSENTVDIVYRGSDDKLKHYTIADDPWRPGRSGTIGPLSIVSDLVATDKDAFLITDSPSAVVDASGRTHVIARSGRTVLHFTRSPSGVWSANNVTDKLVRQQPIGSTYRYFVDSTLVVRPRGSAIDVFAIDEAFDHLIHFEWDGTWLAEDLPQLTGGTFRIEHPVAYDTELVNLHVVGLNLDGHLIQFARTSDGNWTAIDVSAELQNDARLEGIPAITSTSQSAASLLVFARSGIRLYLFAYFEQWGWWVNLDLTESVHPTQAIEGDPVVINRRLGTFDLFVTDLNQHLLHYYMRDDALAVEDVTDVAYGGTISGRPIVFNYGEDRLDVFGRSPFGKVVHLLWEPEVGWHSENLPSPTWYEDTPPRPLTSDPVVIRRRASAMDVFANYDGPSVHFFAGAGEAISPWHSREEYSQWASGSLRDFHYSPLREFDDVADASGGMWQDNNVDMKCLSFDLSPAERAATMLHEATHVIFWRWSHQANSSASNCLEPCSDNWMEHGIGDPDGALGDDKNHSMTQIEVEFLCDIAEFPNWSIPQDSYVGARGEANSLMANRILDPPGWVCGIPRPL